MVPPILKFQQRNRYLFLPQGAPQSKCQTTSEPAAQGRECSGSSHTDISHCSLHHQQSAAPKPNWIARDTNCTPLDIIIPSSHTSKRSTIPSFIDHAFHLRGPSCHRWGACHEGRRRRQQPSPTIVVVVVHSLPSIGWWWCLLRSTTTHPTTTSNVPTILHFLLLLFHRTNSSPTIW